MIIQRLERSSGCEDQFEVTRKSCLDPGAKWSTSHLATERSKLDSHQAYCQDEDSLPDLKFEYFSILIFYPINAIVSHVFEKNTHLLMIVVVGVSYSPTEAKVPGSIPPNFLLQFSATHTLDIGLVVSRLFPLRLSLSFIS